MDITGERQVAPTLDGIRRDHVARYEWAAKLLGTGKHVADMACGVGYGTQILANAGHDVVGYDKDGAAVAYGRKFYPRGKLGVAADECPASGVDAVVCFETIEHVADPKRLLRSFDAPLLLASVPNEDVLPYGHGFAFHHRHYTKDEFAELLRETCWEPVEWWGQEGTESEVERDVNGRTLIAVARRGTEMCVEPTKVPVAMQTSGARPGDDYPVPEHVAILGLGPSLERYVDMTKRLGGKHAYCDEVWGINAVGGTILCDRIFHMDDVRVQEIRATAAPASNIARMLEWLRLHPGPIITSRAHPDYPGLVEFPLAKVLTEFRHAYFNSTAAYAVAYAIFLGVKKLSLFGCDYTYPNAHHAEQGRACLEFWLGMATARKMQISIPQESSLMDALHTQAERLYGYDTLDVTIRGTPDGPVEVDFVERESLPVAQEIEAKYDHAQHPNHLARTDHEH